MPFDSIQEWQEVMSLCCETTKTIKITSYGDWDFSLMRKPKEGLSRPLYDIIKQHKDRWHSDNGEQDNDYEFTVKEYPQLKNVLEGFENITVNINYSQEEFREMFGFWEISNFKVYNRDGNYSLCSFDSFDDQQYCYFGEYCTS